MVSVNTWYASNQQRIDEHDEKVNVALYVIASQECRYVSHTTFKLTNDILRTEIFYEEIEIRRVLFEKHK